MQLTLPRRIPLVFIIGFASTLFTIQVGQGTSLYFAACMFAFNTAFGIAFNMLGGLSSVNGFILTSLAIRTVILSQLVKVILEQPADFPLRAPNETAGVMAMGMIGLLIAAMLASQLRFPEPVFRPIHDPQQLTKISTICLVLSLMGFLTERMLPQQGNQILYGLLVFFKLCSPLSIITATAATLISSDNRKCISMLVFATFGLAFLNGLVGASKLLMFEPGFCFLLTCVVFRFHFRKRFIAVILAATFVAATFLTVVSDVGRNIYRKADFAENLELFSQFITGPGSLKRLYDLKEEFDAQSEFTTSNYFQKDLGLLNRFALIEWSDKLVHLTLRQGPEGLNFLFHSFTFLPRSLTGQTTHINPGNYFGRRIGDVGDSDDVTSIAFGCFADAFALNSWPGVAILPAFLFLLFFSAIRQFVGEGDFDIWKVFLCTCLQHGAAESGISFPVFFLARTLPFLIILYWGLLKVTSGRWRSLEFKRRRSLQGEIS